MTFLIGVTGHRKLEHPREDVEAALFEALNKIKPLYVITGMAIGFDQLVAEACLKSNIKYIAAVPFVGQDSIWPEAAREQYKELLDQAWLTYLVNDGGYESWKLFDRNRWIAEKSNLIISYWNGKPSGGTAHAIKTAKDFGKDVVNLFDCLPKQSS